MVDYILTPNMSLPEPIVGQSPGPDFADQINQALTLVDQHDHSIGKGVQITPAGMNINSALNFNGNFATGLAGLTLSAQGSTPALSTVYEVGNDLYFVDGVGNVVRITQSGAVAGTPGSISNLVAPASASYVGASSSFVWQSNTNVSADMDGGNVIFREKVASAKGVTLASPTGLAADYTMTWPAALPASTLFLTLTAAGEIGVATGIQPTQIAAASITKAQQVAVGQQLSASTSTYSTFSGSFVDVTSVSLTTSGRPVVIGLIADGSGNESVIGTSVVGAEPESTVYFQIIRGATVLSLQKISLKLSTAIPATWEYYTPVGCINHTDVVAAGTYTYKLQAKVDGSGASTAHVNYAKLIVYEL